MSFICFFKINSISLNCQYFYVLKNGIISFLAPKLKKKIKNYEIILSNTKGIMIIKMVTKKDMIKIKK